MPEIIQKTIIYFEKNEFQSFHFEMRYRHKGRYFYMIVLARTNVLVKILMMLSFDNLRHQSKKKFDINDD